MVVILKVGFVGIGFGFDEYVIVFVEYVIMCCFCDEVRNLYWYFFLLCNLFMGIINV